MYIHTTEILQKKKKNIIKCVQWLLELNKKKKSTHISLILTRTAFFKRKDFIWELWLQGWDGIPVGGEQDGDLEVEQTSKVGTQSAPSSCITNPCPRNVASTSQILTLLLVQTHLYFQVLLAICPSQAALPNCTDFINPNIF